MSAFNEGNSDYNQLLLQIENPVPTDDTPNLANLDFGTASSSTAPTPHLPNAISPMAQRYSILIGPEGTFLDHTHLGFHIHGTESHPKTHGMEWNHTLKHSPQ